MPVFPDRPRARGRGHGRRLAVESALVPVGSRPWRPWPRKAGMGMAVRIDGWMDVQFIGMRQAQELPVEKVES
uniref:Uncharacterized protein n=1 Tax=Oryza rufipogon TaxID=4529 RepID=A0A0E0QYA8_ORYRU